VKDGESFLIAVTNPYIGFKRLSASLHVKETVQGETRHPGLRFQTPFGITACESSVSRYSITAPQWFQTPFGITACERLLATAITALLSPFQTPFGITACESKVIR